LGRVGLRFYVEAVCLNRGASLSAHSGGGRFRWRWTSCQFWRALRCGSI